MKVVLQNHIEGTSARISGTIPATLTDFEIDPPSLLAIPVKNDIPVRVTKCQGDKMQVRSLRRRQGADEGTNPEGDGSPKAHEGTS